MRDIQDSQIYIELLKLLYGKRSCGLATIQFIGFLCERDSASIPEFLKGRPGYDRSSSYATVRKLVKLGIIEKISQIPTPNDFGEWSKTRKVKWNAKNRGAKRFRLSLDTAMKTIDGKIQELESLKERLNSIKDPILEGEVRSEAS